MMKDTHGFYLIWLAIFLIVGTIILIGVLAKGDDKAILFNKLIRPADVAHFNNKISDGAYNDISEYVWNIINEDNYRDSSVINQVKQDVAASIEWYSVHGDSEEYFLEYEDD